MISALTVVLADSASLALMRKPKCLIRQVGLLLTPKTICWLRNTGSFPSVTYQACPQAWLGVSLTQHTKPLSTW